MVIFTLPLGFHCVFVVGDSPPRLSCSYRPCRICQERKVLTTLYSGHSSGLCFPQPKGKTQNLPPGQKADWLTAYYKIVDSPSSIHLSCDATHCMCRHSSRPRAWNNCSKQSWCQHTDAHPACCTVRNEVSYLWPRTLSSGSIHKTVTG